MLTDSACIYNAVHALEEAFIWNNTPPGFDYWCDVCDTLIDLALKAEAIEAESAEQETNEVY